jgi:hypothetical protein
MTGWVTGFTNDGGGRSVSKPTATATGQLDLFQRFSLALTDAIRHCCTPMNSNRNPMKLSAANARPSIYWDLTVGR